jgi:uncharacterized DUF497 family protein
MQFEFDAAKSASNKAKHGLDFVEIQYLWKSVPRLRKQANIVEGQMRYAIIGHIKKDLYTVIVTYHGASIRIISARRSNQTESEAYAKATEQE